MERIHVFLDESGAFGFDFSKPKCSSHVIIAAILVNESDLHFVSKEIDKLRKKYFQTGEIKSSNLKDKHFRKRIELLKAISLLPIHIALLIVDKRKIFEDSHIRKFKKTFYKFIYQQLYADLLNSIKNIAIHPDEVGGKQDLEEFSRYYYRKAEEYSLFHDIDFAFDDSKNSLLVQAADLVAGSIAKNIDASRVNAIDSTDYLSLLKSKILYRKDFPWSKEVFLQEAKFDSEADKEIAELSLRLVDQFCYNNSGSDDLDIKQQIATLQYLRFRFVQNQFRRYIRPPELMNHLVNSGFDKMSVSTFRMKIIARLRDEGVILASSANGYKIPSKVSEVYDFVNHGKNVILPMLNRLKKCNDTIKLATNNSINLFEKAEYKELADLLDANSNLS